MFDGDVSATGMKLTVAGVPINDYADDQSPIEVEPIEIAAAGVNINGQMVHWSKPSLVNIKISVIPGSPSDYALWAIWKRDKINPGGGIKVKPYSIVVQSNGVGQNDSWVYANARMTNGPAGDAVSNEGRINGHTYSFIAENVA